MRTEQITVYISDNGVQHDTKAKALRADLHYWSGKLQQDAREGTFTAIADTAEMVLSAAAAIAEYKRKEYRP